MAVTGGGAGHFRAPAVAHSRHHAAQLAVKNGVIRPPAPAQSVYVRCAQNNNQSLSLSLGMSCSVLASRGRSNGHPRPRALSPPTDCDTYNATVDVAFDLQTFS